MQTSLAYLKAIAAVGALVMTFGSAAAEPQERQGLDVSDDAIYVDLPTAFAFIKLPDGWKFVGKLDSDQLRHLPPDTLTSLLTDEPKVASIDTSTGDGAGNRR